MTIRILKYAVLAIFLVQIGNTAAAESGGAASDAALGKQQTESPRRFYASIGTGFDFSRGDYGEEDAAGQSVTTDTFSVPFFTKLEWEPVTFRASVPVLYIDGSDQVTGDGPQGGVVDERTTFGIGDIVTSLTYTYYPDRQSALPAVDLIVKVKIHTSTPDDLGSSGTDVALGTELSKTFGRFAVFGGFSRRFKTGKDFDDIWLASVGGSIRLAKWITIGAAYDFREASTSGSSVSHEISPYASLRLSDHVRMTPYGVIGFSDGAPDWGVGSSLSYEF